MSVTHLIVPYDEQFESESFLTWFEKEIPSNVCYGRTPTWGELKALFEQYTPEGWLVQYDTSTYPTRATIRTPSHDEYTDSYSYLLSVEVLDQQVTDDTVGFYSFRGDRAVLEKMLTTLPSEHGTFLVMTNGEDPELITAGGDS